jgi:hypothetical protein
MLDPRNPLIKNVTNNLFPFDKDSLPSAYVLGKILSGITQDALNLDTCVKAGVYRFNTNFTSPASEEIPFEGQSGFIVVHGINPTEEPNTSAFANENRIRQVVYIDGLEAEGYTRTGIGTGKVGEGDEATYTWQWSPEWKSLTSAEVPSATIGMRYKNDNDQYVYNLNLYIKSGCWIVGKPAPPSPTQWTNFPTNITSTEQHGYLVVYTEDSEDVTIGNAPTYFQIWYPINLYDRTPFIRSKKYNSSTWESWRRVGQESALSVQNEEDMYYTEGGATYYRPGIFQITKIASIIEADTLPAIAYGYMVNIIIDRNTTEGSSGDKHVLQTFYPMYASVGGTPYQNPMPITRFIRGITTTSIHFPWQQYAPQMVHWPLTKDIVPTNSVDKVAVVNRMYYSYGNYTLTLPCADLVFAGTKIGLIQCDGIGKVQVKHETSNSITHELRTPAQGGEFTNDIFILAFQIEQSNNGLRVPLITPDATGFDRVWEVTTSDNKWKVRFDYNTTDQKWTYKLYDLLWSANTPIYREEPDQNNSDPWNSVWPQPGHRDMIQQYQSFIGPRKYVFEVIQKAITERTVPYHLAGVDANEWRLIASEDYSEQFVELAEAIQQEAVAREEADNNILSVTESKIATKEPRTITMDVRTARVPGNIYYDSDEDPSVCQPYTEDEELPGESALYIGTYKKCNLAHYNLRINCYRTSIGEIRYGSTPEEPQVVYLPSPLMMELNSRTLRDDVLIDVFLYSNCYLLFKNYDYTYDNQFVTEDIESFYHTKDALLLRIMLQNARSWVAWVLQVTK